ncbi:VWA domain-containing protein [Stieleria sp. ICT_E10.1]|uniref:vWA domain-containing protein n=1 Tax=Stieleria sedimenti TaxID=2976331 RepID=UPI002180149E|nr:vWA domain-containing protein [Stieleria sedimenti]MCS7466481.1 VWA domain-containing protein [Stieleria sedimenti]
MSELPNEIQSTSGPQPSPNLPSDSNTDQTHRHRLRELELELDRIRCQADAARLDAQAAELELQIERLREDLDHDDVADLDSKPPATNGRLDSADRPGDAFGSRRSRPPKAAKIFHRDQATADDSPDESRPAERGAGPRPDPTNRRFDNWSQVRDALGRSVVAPAGGNSSCHESLGTHSQGLQGEGLQGEGLQGEGLQGEGLQGEGLQGEGLPKQGSRVDPARTKRSQSWSPSPKLAGGPAADRRLRCVPAENIDLAAQASDPPRRRKPAAWLLSAVFHGLILLALAFFTLSSPPPGDQIAIAGSVAETEELAIESLSIETPEVPPTSSEPTPSDLEHEISDIGEISVSDLISEAPAAPPTPLIESMIQRDATSMAAMSLKSDSDATMSFCGVDGGGNHFVYLVDSSGSMGDAFDSARAELLQSIRLLKPDQRFYVIFFDAEPDYMRLSSPDEDEPRSVYATAENKQRLQRWAMTIKMDRGRAPYDALPFALELNPDVIFLLSDGEFPQRIEDLLGEINRIDNLFGDDGPISIVHTIGYHSREGESRMRRIAKQNGGQYRYVPKPNQ